MSISFHRAAPGALFLLAVATCSPDYQSGVTACAATEPRCPDGYFCSGIRCYANGTPGVQANNGGVGGTGTAGAGGVPAFGGRGGSAPPAMGGSPPPPSGGRGGSPPPPSGGVSGSGGRGGSPPPTGGAPPPPATAARCGALTAEDDCEECFYKGCCTEIQACLSASTCTMYIDCLDGCKNSGCEMMCGVTHRAGAALFDAASRCESTKCAAQCGGAQPPPPMPPPGQPGTGTVAKFCNGLMMGMTPTTLTVVLGIMRMTATTGQCSTPIGTTCATVPTGPVDLRMEFNGQAIAMAGFDLKPGFEYVFLAALDDAGKPALRGFELEAPERCSTITPQDILPGDAKASAQPAATPVGRALEPRDRRRPGVRFRSR